MIGRILKLSCGFVNLTKNKPKISVFYAAIYRFCFGQIKMKDFFSLPFNFLKKLYCITLYYLSYNHIISYCIAPHGIADPTVPLLNQ